MTTIAHDIIDRIEERRQKIIADVQALVKAWFDNDGGRYKFKNRYYAPHVEIRGRGTANEAASIYWSSRFPLNAGFGKQVTDPQTGKTKKIYFGNKRVAANSRGQAYPLSKFPRAPETELMEIEAIEAILAPMRTELAFLGRERRRWREIYTALGFFTQKGPIRDESLPEW